MTYSYSVQTGRSNIDFAALKTPLSRGTSPHLANSATISRTVYICLLYRERVYTMREIVALLLSSYILKDLGRVISVQVGGLTPFA